MSITPKKQNRRLVLSIALPISLVLLAACASIGSSTSESQLTEPAALGLHDTKNALAALDWPKANWWTEYGDPQLDHLIERSFTGSPSIKLAEARIRQAQQTEALVGSRNGPGLALNAASVRERLSENYIYPPPLAGTTQTDGRAALDFSYEFDFWGKHREAMTAAALQTQALKVEAESAKMILSIAVARTYFQLQRRYEELAIAQDTLKQRQAIAAIIAVRVKNGLDNRSEIHLPTARISSVRQDLGSIEEGIALLKHQLAALTGQGPEAAEKITPPKLSDPVKFSAPADLPIDLLGRRPDIVAQRIRIEATGKEITAARNDFYPNVNLSAFFGFQAIGVNTLFQAGSRTAGIGPAIHLPIFQAGRLRANLGAKYAEYDIIVEQYNQTLIDAVREVADQGSTIQAISRQREASAETLAALRRAYEVALVRYRSGLASQLPLLNAESDLLSQRRVEAELRDRERQTGLALIKALGGGYSHSADSGENNAK